MLFQSSRLHNHLDWHNVNQWLDSQGEFVRLGWDDQNLLGVMAAAPPLHGTTWLRLVSVTDRAPVLHVLEALWARLAVDLRAVDVHTVAILLIEEWLREYVPRLGFAYDQDIVTLRRRSTQLPPIRPPTLAIRFANNDDLPRIAEVDQAAFAPPWQMSLDDLRSARRLAASHTVAEHNGQIVGYQLSTMYHQTGHLARLAVIPELHGHGIGAALLDDLIGRFLRRSIDTVTVNTQSNNLRSQRLYARYNFERTGYDLPVWQVAL